MVDNAALLIAHFSLALLLWRVVKHETQAAEEARSRRDRKWRLPRRPRRDS